MKFNCGLISPLYTGVKRSISKLIPVNSNTHFSVNKYRFLQTTYGDGPLMRSLHTSSGDDDDDFSELDLPPTEKRFNLLTEKPSSYTLNMRKASGRHSQKKSDPKVAATKGNNLQAFADTSITIENIPVSISVNQLRKAVSKFGEVLDASIRSESEKLNSCDVEFESQEAKERAIASGGVIFDLHHLPIRTALDNLSVTIRISGIGLGTAEPAIHSMCMSCGNVKSLVRTKEKSVDVVFGVKDSSARYDIVDRLNADVCAENGWTAEILGEGSGDAAAVVSKESGLELYQLLEEIQWQTQFKKIYSEDLAKLHQCVLHLQNRPHACP